VKYAAQLCPQLVDLYRLSRRRFEKTPVLLEQDRRRVSVLQPIPAEGTVRTLSAARLLPDLPGVPRLNYGNEPAMEPSAGRRRTPSPLRKLELVSILLLVLGGLLVLAGGDRSGWYSIALAAVVAATMALSRRLSSSRIP
jgi:hypothetical protein